MQSHWVLTWLFIACLTILQSYLPHTQAATTQRPYEFGFTIDKQQHRHEEKDERGIVMGEFGFITADGIYHVTVYATDEEGKFRILAMRSYPYEEHPKTIDMIVRPKAKTPAMPKAIPPSPAPIATTTTTQRPKPKPFEKHNFSVQGCSGCFIKNNAPTTTTKTPDDRKYDITPLSKPLAGENGKQMVGENGKQMVAQLLPQVLLEVQQVKKMLMRSKANLAPKQTEGIYQIQNTPLTPTTATQNDLQIPVVVEGTTPQTITKAITQNILAKTQSTKAIEESNTKMQTTLHNSALNTQNIQDKAAPTDIPHITLSTDTTRLSASTNALSETSRPPPGSAFNSNTAQTPTMNAFGGGNSEKAPTRTGANAPSAGPRMATNAFATPKNGLSAPPPAVSGLPNVNTRFGGGGSGSLGSGGVGRVGGGGLGNNFRPIAGQSGTGSGAGTSNSASETGDLYRFKYILDYNGHRETGARNGNKEGSYYAIGDDNVERTIEYTANEFGYQPRLRFRKLDAPVQAKENTLKDYEFVWFNEKN